MSGSFKISDRLGLIYNFACPLKCDFCCHPPENYGHGKMDPSDVVEWIRQAAEIDSIVDVAISGGEPFIYIKEIIWIWEELGKDRLPFRIVTSAIWGRDYEKSYNLLKVLKELGLNTLGISYDDSHSEFVEPYVVQNVLRAADELQIPCQVVGNFWNTDRKVQDLLQVPDNGLNSIANDFVYPAGRAEYANIQPQDYGVTPDLSDFRCMYKEKFYDIAIYPDGNLYPCCSGGFQVKGKLSVGNLHSESLKSLLDKVHSSIYVRILKEKSFKFLYELIEKEDPELFEMLPRFDDKVTGCQLCEKIHGSDAIMAMLSPILEKYEIEYVKEQFGQMEQLLAHGQHP